MTFTDEQIEKAARAAFFARYPRETHPSAWDFISDKDRARWRSAARAALEAVMPGGNQNGPDWEGFGRAVMADWPEGGDIDGFTLQDMAVEHGLLREVPGGFNPEEHIDVTCCAEPGDVWFELTFPSNRDSNRKPALEPGELERLRAENERLREALEEIANLSERPYDKFPSDWRDQIAACPECHRYKDHPIQRGICNDHRKPLYDREDHNRHETSVLGYRAKSIAHEALATRRAAHAFLKGGE